MRTNQIEQTLKAAKRNPRDYALLLFLFRTGARISEVVGDQRHICGECEHYDFRMIRTRKGRIVERECKHNNKSLDNFNIPACLEWTPWFRGVRVEDIDWTLGAVTLHRKRHARTFRIHQIALDPETLTVLRQHIETHQIKKGKLFPITVRQARRIWRKYVKTPILTLHASRHSHITFAYEVSEDPLGVRQRAGHESLSSTMRYAHLGLEHDRKLNDKLYPQKEAQNEAKKTA